MGTLAGLAGLVALRMVVVVRRRRRIRWWPPSGRVHELSLHVRTLGQSAPPVLLLHGFTGSHLYWGGVFDQLAAETCLVVPDLLGFGGSHGRGDRFSVDDHVDAVVSGRGPRSGGNETFS